MSGLALVSIFLSLVLRIQEVQASTIPFDFSVPANYSVGNATKTEVTTNQARLKSLQYTSDTDTSALYHFDETSGNVINDVSTGNNDITESTTTPCVGASWGAGKVVDPSLDRAQYGSLSTNGLAGCISANDSPSLSLSSQVTLEAYIKFSNAFDQTNSITQGVLDKGNYRMYFDESDGKLKFELDDSSTKTWQKVGGSALTPTTPGINGNDGINGSWRQAIPHTIWAIKEFNNELYVGTYGSGTDLGTGEVWKYSGANQTWTKVGGDGNGSTNWDTKSTEGVFSLEVYNSALYAGLGLGAGDAEVWRYSGSGTTWTKIAGGGVNSSWTTGNAIEFVASLVSDGTYLYAGTGSTAASAAASDADVWRYNGTSWTQIGGTNNSNGTNVNSSWGAFTATTNAFETVRSMVVMGTDLYVGLGDTAAAASYADGEVWRWNGSTWTKVGGDGTGWAANTFEYVFSLATDGTTLYAGLGASASDADVWACTSCGTTPSWTQIGGDEVNASKPNWNTGFETVRSLIYVNGKLYASLGDTQGDAEVWRYDTTSWTKVAGDGVNSTWDASFTTPAGTTNTKEYTFLGVFGSSLVAGTGATPQDAEVWSCTSCDSSPAWTWIGGRDFRSWGSFQPSYITSMAVNAGKLYVGTGATNKHAAIWEYNGSTWTQVGGGNLNQLGTSWENYEYVLSMATYKGDLYAGFGSTADDADVWKFSGGSWTQVGGTTAVGATVNSSWTDANNIEEVVSLVSDEAYLYAGTGNTAGDGDVWRFNGTAWSQIGGDTVNNSWASATFERVQSMKVANGLLFVGLGSSAGDAEVWRWNGTNWGTNTAPNTTRNRIGGDGDATFSTTWNRSDLSEVVRESVRSMTFIDTTLYVALGDTNDSTTAADAEVWACTNCLDTTINANAVTKPNWTKVGGDGVNGSWDNLTYEQVTSISTYKGHLFASLGINNSGTDYDSEVWEYDGSIWQKVGGDGSTADTWGGNYELAGELIVLNGRLYTGLGTTNNNGSASDGEVWEYGANTSKIAASTTSSWQAGRWYHIAATYDGTTAKLFVCDSTNLVNCTGTPETTSSFGTMTLADTDMPLSIASLHGSLGPDRSYGGFAGNIDEIRISSIARPFSDFAITQFASDAQTVQPISSIPRTQIHSWAAFSGSETTNGGTITYRLSSDDGATWKYWNSGWTASASVSQASPATTINSHLSTFPMTTSGLLWQAVLSGNGDQQVILNSVTVAAVDDTNPPNDVASISGNDGAWYNRANPVFTWSAPTDDIPSPNPNSEQASGVEGYYVYFGTNASADPVSAGAFQTGTSYTGTAISAGDTQAYYLRIKTRDNAQNVSATTFDYFRDTNAPNNVASVTGNANSGNWYNRANPVFTWSAPTDPLPSPNTNNEIASGIKGYFVYFGTNPNAIPRTAGTFVTSPTYTASPIDPSDTQIYYLRIQTEDKALNITSDGSIYDAFRDTAAPNNVSSVTGNAGQWFDRTNPVFTWSAPSDNANGGEIASGIAGYYVYFGTNPNAVPRTAGTFVSNTTYTASPISGSDTQKYYFLIQTRDANFNTTSDSTGVLNAFIDTVVPNNVSTVSGNANSGLWYDRTNPVFSWTAPSDGAAGVGEKESGIGGYFVYFGTNANAVPRTDGVFVTALTYTASPISPSDTQAYYFRIQTRDRAMNVTSDSTGVLDGFRDTNPPNNVDAVTALSTVGGSALVANTWYNHEHPYFSWSAPTDDVPNPNTNNENASGVKGYYVYFGSDHNAVPRTAGTLQTGTSYTAGTLTSGTTYYLRIQTIDNALNTTSDISGILDAFTYKIDTVGPNGPTVSVSPAGYTAVNSYTFFWLSSGTGSSIDPVPGSGTPDPKQYVYRVGSGSWSVPTTETTITIPDAAYQEGANVFEIRAFDNVGNQGSSSTVTFYYAGSAPTAPENLTVSPDSSVNNPSSSNSFAFQWDAPSSSISPIKVYHFSINKLPTSTNTQSTPLEGLRAAPYATQQGKNTFYVVAEDEAGNVNYDNPAHVDFYALTPAPEAPTQAQIFDISNRDTQEYAISMKWSEPSKSNGFDGYEVYRSEDGTNYVSAGTTKSPVFIDTNLTSQPYYYKVRSKDNAGQYSIDSSVVILTPTGRFTSPPKLLAPPTITTKSYSASMTWDTDRIASSFIEYGPDAYHLGKQNGGDTVGTLDLTTHHVVSIKGLNPETTYAYRAVWVDQDGNRGESDTLSFVTGLRPRISEVKVTNITLTSATISWQSTTVVSSSVKYGTTKSLGLQVDDTGNTGDKHTLRLDNLTDTAQYFFGISGTDADGNIITSDIYNFNTLTRPIVSDLKVEPVREAPTTTLKVAWKTNVPTTSIVVYGTVGAGNRTQSDATYATEHEQVLSSLSDNSPYTILAKSIDQYGNSASSDTRQITTPGDTRPPKVTNLNIEVRSTGVGAAQKAQLIVTWDTDEPSTSQVEFGPGISSDNYPSRTAEDTSLTNSHTVIVPELEPAKIYHLRAVARDRAGNAGHSSDTTAITGKVQRSVIDIITGSLQNSLGFLSKLSFRRN